MPPNGRLQIGTMAGFKSERVAGFRLGCMAGFVGTARSGEFAGGGVDSVPFSPQVGKVGVE